MASRWRPATRGPGRVASRRPEPRRGASLRYGVKLSEASPLRLLTRQRRQTMTKVLVLYYSSFGHIEKMAEAVAQGVRDAGAEAIVKRVPELVPEEIAKKSGFKLDQAAPIATVAELPDYDAIIFGVPTRFGNMPAQMKNFLDQTGGHWVQGKLIGKPGSVFTSSATQHGGQETTITSFHATLLHHGMVVVGVPYNEPGLLQMDEISGGTPYGATTLAGSDGSRQPTKNELKIALHQGKHVTTLAGKLFR